MNKPVTIAVTAKLDDTVAAAKLLVDGVLGRDGNWGTPDVVESAAAGRYVKISCQNNGLLPAWHNAPGVLGHLMLDEILVNPGEAKK